MTWQIAWPMQETAPGALTEAELVEKLRDVHVLGIRSKMHVSADAIKAARRLLAIGCFCIGTNQVDLEVGSLSALFCTQSSMTEPKLVAEVPVIVFDRIKAREF